MKISNEEMQLRLLEHLSQILSYFMTDEDTQEEDLNDIIDDCEDIVGLMIMSMNLKIDSVVNEKNNEFLFSAKLEDPISFIESLSEL
jgi:hypothetical protein